MDLYPPLSVYHLVYHAVLCSIASPLVTCAAGDGTDFAYLIVMTLLFGLDPSSELFFPPSPPNQT